MTRRIVAHLSTVDAVMAGVIQALGPTKIALNPEGTPFEALASAIAHQQLHGAAARTILKRFVEQVGGGTFPTPQKVLKRRKPRCAPWVSRPRKLHR